MNAQDCLQILRQIKGVAFATVDENGLPQVRIIDVMLVEQGRLYFCTARGKDFFRQLEANGQAAITGMNEKYQMVRLTGRAHRLTGQKQWIDRIFEQNPSMNAVYPGDSRYILEPFCIDNGQIEFFDLGTEPIHRASFSLAGEPVRQKGFVITDACIGCGRCSRQCPQQCIAQGAPYRIRQANCLHCGLCAEVCPAHAIKRRGE